jgi:hypothetical protein
MIDEIRQDSQVVKMMTRLGRRLAGSVVVVAAAMVSGCPGGQSGPIKETDNITAIRKAYVAATKRLGHPPKNIEELKPSLEGDAAELLISPNDGLPYVIVFGADPKKHVIAYEAKGVDGVRMVVDQGALPRRVSQDQFDMLTFAPGHKKPSGK